MSKKVTASARAAYERPVEQCIALIDYDALNSDEISFKAGDVINVTGKGAASGFWEGYVAVPTYPAMATVEAGGGSDNEREASTASSSHAPPSPPHHGLFPNCLVTSNMRFKSTMANYLFQNIALCLYSYRATGEGEMSLEPGDVIAAVRPSASPGWWYGVKSTGPAWTAPAQPTARFADPARNANGGSAVPPSFSSSSPSPPSLSTSTEAQEQLFPTNFVTCDVVLISFHFAGRQAHELSCRTGDVVQVHRRWNDGWWEGSLRDRRGIFPSNYSVPNICTTSPPLFCAKCRTVFPSNTFQSSCSTCAAEARVEDAMLQSLEAYVRGEAKEYDLFANVDIGTENMATGEGQPETEAQGDDDDSSEGSPQSGATTSQRNWGKAGGGTEGASQRREHRNGAARVSLLTEKDVADLAANRVKLME